MNLLSSSTSPVYYNTKESKMVLRTALLNTQHNKVRIKGKVEQSKDSALPYTVK